jgi:hypothetical protein
MIDVRFFMIALRWLYAHVLAAAQRLSSAELDAAAERFEQTILGDAKRMRDIWEHLDDYNRGDGRLQRDPHRKAGVAERLQLGAWTWTGSDETLGTLYWAGFSVSLDTAVIEANRLFEALQGAYPRAFVGP